jgi:hypothetical protein
MSFFRQFPKTTYDPLKNGTSTSIIDIFRAVKINELVRDAVTPYQYYSVSDGDRPDIVSHRVYGTTDYDWTFFYVNDSLREGLPAWPKSHFEMEKHLELTYDPFVVLQFATSIENVAVSHFKVGTFPNYVNALQSYPFANNTERTFLHKQDALDFMAGETAAGRTTVLREYFVDNISQFIVETKYFCYGLNSAGIIVGTGTVHSWNPELSQLWLSDVEGDFTLAVNCRIDAASPANLLGWVSKYLPGLYDSAYFSNQLAGFPILVNPDDGSTPYFLYSPDIPAIQAYLAAYGMFSINRVFLSGRTAPHHYVDVGGAEASNRFLFGDSTFEEASLTPITNYEWEEAQNDGKRQIRIIRPELITSFADQFEKVLNA